MPITFSCPHCNKNHAVHDNLAGRAAKCSCGNTITVPAISLPQESSAEAVPSAPHRNTSTGQDRDSSQKIRNSDGSGVRATVLGRFWGQSAFSH